MKSWGFVSIPDHSVQSSFKAFQANRRSISQTYISPEVENFRIDHAYDNIIHQNKDYFLAKEGIARPVKSMGTILAKNDEAMLTLDPEDEKDFTNDKVVSIAATKAVKGELEVGGEVPDDWTTDVRFVV
ncbi:hypothetical protein CBS101457_003295 [Exobasidium rhododendri]|nr:hypothetical protein CBS101457_003295 [Exobasidium rhododendri]